MTDEQRQRLRTAKRLVTERLSGMLPLLPRYAYALGKTDERLEWYALEVIGHPEGHNLWEQLALLRYLRMLDRYSFSRPHVVQFIRFAEMVKTSGQGGRRTLRLTPVQTFFAALLFGLRDDEGRRLTTLAYLFIPRKFGKTTFAAVLAVFDMLCGDFNAEAYVAANSHDQAKICFREIKNILRCFDPSERVFKINREEVTFRNVRIRESSARCLTANARTKDGLFASLAIIDEYAQARNTASSGGADLKKVLMSSMGPRREPLTIVITTASTVLDGPFIDELDGVQRVLAGELATDPELVNDRMQALLFCPDADDADDSEQTWRKVQPHWGVTVQEDFYAREWQTALMSADYMTEFRTKYLNIFCVNEERQWVDAATADRLMAPAGRLLWQVAGLGPCMGAFDLSVHDDMSAIAYVGFSQATQCFHVHIDYWLPEQAAVRHPLHDLYDRWHTEGHLNYCRGEVIDDQALLAQILDRARRVNLRRMAYDRYKARDLVNLLALQSGKDALTSYSQTIGAFNMPVEIFEKLAFTQPPRIQFDDNPITRWQLCNCVLRSDNLDNRKPFKASPERKIDGIVCTLMALALAAE